MRRVGVLLLLFLLVPAFAQDADVGFASVRAVWTKNVNSKNLKGLEALYGDDAVLLSSSGMRIIGKASIAAFFLDSASALTITLTSAGPDSSGDLGYDTGDYEEVVRTGGSVIGGQAVIGGNSSIGGGGQSKTKRGSYLFVLKRKGDAWLIVQQAITEIQATK